MGKTVLITGIGGLTPRSIARTLRRNHPDYRLVGCDIDPTAIGFFMSGLLDVRCVCPRCDDSTYFPWIERLVEDEGVDYAFVQPEAEVVAWAAYRESNGSYPCPTLMGGPRMTSALRDKGTTAELLEGTEFIPRTITITQDNPRMDDVESIVGYPSWVRATRGTGGLGSLRLDEPNDLRGWLAMNPGIPEFTVSELLPGRHIANEMLYYEGEYLRGAALECAEYVMASTAPSRVTGNTRLGRLIDGEEINEFCDACVRHLEQKLDERVHGVLSFDLKEDAEGNPKVTEVNIRHMAYTGVLAEAGFDLVEDTVRIMEDGDARQVRRERAHRWDGPRVFLRDVDVEPMLLSGDDAFDSANMVKAVNADGAR